MRASSWGDVGEYGRFAHAHEAASMHSGAGDHDEPLDPDVVVVGAGGVATGPLPPTPSASAGVLAAGGFAPPYITPAEVLCRVAPSPPLTAGPTSRGSQCSGLGAVASAMAGRWHSPPQAPRSLMQLSSSYSSEALRSGDGVGNGDGEGDDDDDDGSDGDSDSFFARNSEEAARPRVVGLDAPRAVFQHDGSYGVEDRRREGDDDWDYGAQERRAGPGRGESVYGDEEEEEEDDDDASDEDSGGPPIEVRRRRPSWAVHDDVGDHGDNDDDGDDDGLPPPPPGESESSDGAA
jgi:hypothetical protein